MIDRAMGASSTATAAWAATAVALLLVAISPHPTCHDLVLIAIWSAGVAVPFTVLAIRSRKVVAAEQARELAACHREQLTTLMERSPRT
ncbi:hypothetical protein [Nonomuraea basaltis]|uniref:hypothetical protein n=1 Tax=Nonomuraea basaltis TaxID=2495887 RepID=UPI00110C5335|nr:hypothetical protein [Nonomuraea basaltis]TMR91296.1 hypothetical protein EJK15_50795 [Nonomuraea basaltis]